MEKIVKYKNLVITEAEREFTKKFDEEEFTIRIPLPMEQTQIITRISRAIGGQPINSMPTGDYEFITLVVTLNTVIVKNPDWWKGAEECPDKKLLWEIYNFYLDSETVFQEERLKKNVSAGKLEGN